LISNLIPNCVNWCTIKPNINMNKILVFEDDYIWQIKIEQMISKNPLFKIVGFAEDIYKCEKEFILHKPDIIISDIILNRNNVLDHLGLFFKQTPTIFMSNYKEDEHLKKSLEFQNSSFLVKPFHDLTLFSSLHIISKNLKTKENESMTIRTSKIPNYKLSLNQIVKIEADGNYCIIHTSNSKKYAKKKSLNKIMEELNNSRFIRISKYTIVNMDFILKIDYSGLKIIIENEEIQIGRHYRNTLIEKYETD
jgi:DNA-binding LytR/AlgR family response regulator